jgi:hypothetical protein
VTDRRDNCSDFRFEATIKPDEDPKEAETRWYGWNKEEKRWEFYSNETPSWGELSEGNKDIFARTYDFIFRKYYEKERSEAIERGMDPQELPVNLETMVEILYYLDKVKKHGADE